MNIEGKLERVSTTLDVIAIVNIIDEVIIMIIRSIKESKLNEALPAPLSKVLNNRFNKDTFTSAARKLRATLDDNTLSKVDKITNRDKRLKDNNYAIFIILDNEVAIFQNGKNIGSSYSDINKMSWTGIINKAEYIYALYIPDARDDDKLNTRDKNNFDRRWNNNSGISGIKKRLGIKNLDKLFKSNGDGTYKVDTSVLDKIEDYINKDAEGIIKDVVNKLSSTELCLVLANRRGLDDNNLRTRVNKIYNNLTSLNDLRDSMKYLPDVITDDTIESIENYTKVDVLYLLDLIK